MIYFIAMFACGIPIFFQEVATGQYLGSGGLTMIGQLVPMLQGWYLKCAVLLHNLHQYLKLHVCLSSVVQYPFGGGVQRHVTNFIKSNEVGKGPF